MTREKSVSLHQQQGGMSLQAFSDREGISLFQAKALAKRGQIFGARQDSRSKHWWVYPPAKLLVEPRGCKVRSAANTSDQSIDQLADQPLEKPVLIVPDAALPVAERTEEHGAPASCGNVYTCPETQSALRVLHDAAVRQYREGIHYLRLEGSEFSQLYAALDRERGRIRKLVGKGLVDIGNLRASDSIWQKLQAVCQQGRLL